MGTGVITALEVQKQNRKRVNVFIDGVFAFGLSLDLAARLHKGQILSDQEIDSLQAEDHVIRAVESAAHFLNYRPRSIHELRRNLSEKGIAPAVIDQVLARLQQMGYADDQSFARFWVESRREFKPLSQKALRLELRRRGVADPVITEAVGDLDEGEQAYRAAAEKIRRLRGSSRQDFKKKLMGLLQRRGFSLSTTRQAVARWMDELDERDPEYFHQTTHDDGE